jgi:fatty acid desaturase
VQKFAKLAGLGAFGVAAGLPVLFGLFVRVVTWPNGEGIDPTEAWVAWIAVGVVVVALAWVHVVFGRILTAIAAGRHFSIENSWLE